MEAIGDISRLTLQVNDPDGRPLIDTTISKSGQDYLVESMDLKSTEAAQHRSIKRLIVQLEDAGICKWSQSYVLGNGYERPEVGYWKLRLQNTAGSTLAVNGNASIPHGFAHVAGALNQLVIELKN